MRTSRCEQGPAGLFVHPSSCSGHPVSVDAAQMLTISEGFSACWRTASSAVITSLLSQQLRRSPVIGADTEFLQQECFVLGGQRI